MNKKVCEEGRTRLMSQAVRAKKDTQEVQIPSFQTHLHSLRRRAKDQEITDEYVEVKR
jgi:hypothetical protein